MYIIELPYGETKNVDRSIEDRELIPVRTLLRMVGHTFCIAHANQDGKFYTQTYTTRLAVAPCLCCGQDDHALTQVYGKEGDLLTERVCCPVS